MVTHKKTKQTLTKIDRSKLKKKAAAVAPAKPEVPKPPRQGMIPGTEPPHYAELGGLAEVLAEKKDAAKAAGKARKVAHDDLVRAMKQRGIPSYVDRGLNLEIRVDIERVKVKKFNHRTQGKKSRRA